MRKHLLFSVKANRDAAWKKYGGRRSSIRNQQIHPMYVEETRTNLSSQDCGIGNTIYKTFFAVLYVLELN